MNNTPAPDQIARLISIRTKAGRAAQGQFKANTFLNSLDPRFRETVERELYYSPIIDINGNGVEFASKSLISPKYMEVLAQLAKTAKAKRERREKLNKRIEASKVRRINPAQPDLGNTGNNLENFEKATREKRYRIQRFIQKNRLPGKNKCDCGAGHDVIYDCETCRRPGNAVCTCGCPIDDYIELKSNKEHGSISTGGTATCGSVWACPVCRSKIVNERSKQLDKIYNEGTRKGWNFYLVTFTIPHSGSDNLAELYGSSTLGVGLSGAFTKFRSSYYFSKKFKKNHLGYIGDVKAVEITWGNINGFHPHIHFIIITKNKMTPGAVKHYEGEFLKEWQKQCEKAGLGIPNKHGVQIDPCKGSEMVQYLSKWSVGSELQSDSAKEARGQNYSIAQLEYMLIDEYKRSSGMNPLGLDKIAGILRAYYKAMHGQKQLQYGNTQTGWKDEIIKDDPDDIDIAKDLEDDLQGNETHSTIAVLKKDLYKQLKKEDHFSTLIEGLEYLDRTLPNFEDLAINKARTILHYLKIPDDGLIHPSETLTKTKDEIMNTYIIEWELEDLRNHIKIAGGRFHIESEDKKQARKPAREIIADLNNIALDDNRYSIDLDVRDLYKPGE